MLTYFRGLRFFESAWLNFCWDGRFKSVEIILGGVENFRGGGGRLALFSRKCYFF